LDILGDFLDVDSDDDILWNEMMMMKVKTRRVGKEEY
jgi:hypothetical protein